MKELIDNLEKTDSVDYLIDTCFFIDVFKKDKVKKLVEFCKNNWVGMSSFNLQELLHIHHKFPGQMNHHIRSFLKQKILFNVPIDLFPGNQDAEKNYIINFDSEILRVIQDPSDAILFVLAIKSHANILTKDKHHIFTAAAENYSEKFNIKVLNEFPNF
jgi:predicted nucleic acid-binding protein